jgi:hypothetical protein
MRSMATFMWTHSDAGAPVAVKPKRTWGGRALRFVVFAPLRSGWWMASRMERSTGIVFTLIVGVVLLVAGFWLSSTFIGMLLGVPMMVAGGFMALRALY